MKYAKQTMLSFFIGKEIKALCFFMQVTEPGLGTSHVLGLLYIFLLSIEASLNIKCCNTLCR